MQTEKLVQNTEARLNNQEKLHSGSDKTAN